MKNRHVVAPFLIYSIVAFSCPGFSADAYSKGASAAEALLAASDLKQRGRYEEALELLSKKRIDEDKESADEYALQKAMLLHEIGQTDKAIEQLRQSAKKHPKLAAIPAELSLLYFETGNYKQATTATKQALALDADNYTARFVTAELLRVSGKLKEAGKAYRWFVRQYNADKRPLTAEELLFTGQAAARYARWNRLHDQYAFLVNELLPEAIGKQADCWQAHVASGRLFLEKYNEVEAQKQFAAARRINPNAPDLLASLAELAILNYEFESAQHLLHRALKVNPNHLRSLLLSADIAFASIDASAALKYLEQAKRINPKHAPTLGRMAAAYCLFDGCSAEKLLNKKIVPKKSMASERAIEIFDAAIKDNAHNGEFFYELGQAFNAYRKFADAAVCFAKANDVMPEFVLAYGQLGMMQMRLGDEEVARKTLDQSFEIDPFNVRIKNTLAVLDVLKTYKDVRTKHFIIRHDPNKDAGLALAAAIYLEEVYPELTQRLGYEPKGPTLIELFNDAKNTDGHGWFSARMVGLPRIHTIGACAGKMIALTSPTSLERGSFNWASVLRHEMVHVINLQQTNFNIPHWYTEGLAVMLEDTPRPAEWNQLLATRVPLGNVYNLETINMAFIRPRSSDNWTMAYCQAELYALYIAERFGPDANAKLLQAYAQGLPTPKAIETCFQVTLEDFEAGYTKRLQQAAMKAGAGEKPKLSFAKLKQITESDPKNDDAAAELALRYLQRSEKARAKKLAERVLENSPKHPVASYVVASIHWREGKKKRPLELLEASLNEKAPLPETLEFLARIYLKTKATKKAKQMLELGAKQQPQNMAWAKRLAAMALKEEDTKQIVRWLAIIAAHENANFLVRKKLALMAEKKEDYAAAERWAEESLHIDISDKRMQAVLCNALQKQKKYAKAADVFEYRIALAPQWPVSRSLRLRMAQTCARIGQKDRALKTLEPSIQAGDKAAIRLKKRILNNE